MKQPVFFSSCKWASVAATSPVSWLVPIRNENRNIAHRKSPHPGLLPVGEGESSPVRSQDRRVGLRGDWIPFSLSRRERFHGPLKAANCAPELEKTELGRVSVLDCASPLALWKSWVVESARGLAHSKTLRWYERFMGWAGVREPLFRLYRFLLGNGMIAFGAIAVALNPGHAAQLAPAQPPDLSEFRTVRTAITTQIGKAAAPAAGQSGYLGVQLTNDARGKLFIADVEAGSPAAQAGLRPGDALVKLAGQTVKSAEASRDLLQSKSPGDTIKLAVTRKGKSLEVAATLGATSRPMKITTERAVMGVQMGEPDEGEGVPIRRLTSGLPAAKAGLRTNDLILKVDGVALTSSSGLTDILAEKKPGDSVSLLVRRKEKEFEKKIELAADREVDNRTGTEPRTLWKKDTYRLAVICVEYPDIRHNTNITAGRWADAFFSQGVYVNTTNATGQPVFGSLRDYYLEQSCGALRVEGKVFDWVEVAKKRADYSQGTSTTSKAAFLNEAVDALLAREGRAALKDFDGLQFIYAGERFPTANRGSLYWPHRGSVTHQGKRWPYFICAEGSQRMGNISVFCHEFGHMLGLPDLYARPESPGSEGLGAWCAMSNEVRGGRPQHFCAWCKEQLGWLKPAVLDPMVKQKLVLSPIEATTSECFKVLLRPDGSEYLLLENRRRLGFDQSLSAEGLLIWRVIGNRPILEESHGVDGPSGPRVFVRSVPYPSAANAAYTPYTTPSSRSLLGGGLPVFITNIRQLADGRITFQIGYEYQ